MSAITTQDDRVQEIAVISSTTPEEVLRDAEYIASLTDGDVSGTLDMGVKIYRQRYPV